MRSLTVLGMLLVTAFGFFALSANLSSFLTNGRGQRWSPIAKGVEQDTIRTTQRLSPIAHGPVKRLLDGGKCLSGDICPRFYYTINSDSDAEETLAYIYPQRKFAIAGVKRLLDGGKCYAYIYPQRKFAIA